MRFKMFGRAPKSVLYQRITSQLTDIEPDESRETMMMM